MSIKKYTEKRPWGKFEQFTKGESSTVKILTVEPHEELSLQYHHHREEFWRIIKGNPTLIIGETTHEAKEGDEFIIQPEEKHRITARDTEVQILEISLGEFDENDIVRLQDKYGR